MIHYLYKILNIHTNEYYLGVRSTSKTPETDRYMGSSSIWTKSYIKEHKDELKKIIIDQSFETRKEANDAEIKIITSHITDPLCINISIPGEEFTQYEHKCPEWKKRLYHKIFSGKGNSFYGKHHTEETKQLIRESIGDSKKGEKNNFYGKHHTKESIEKNRKAHLGVNNKVSKPIKYTNLQTGEVIYFGSINLCIQHFNGKWVPFMKQVKKGRPYRKIHLGELISVEEYLKNVNNI